LKVGDSIIRQVGEGIVDCHFCIALLSKKSVKSRWVQKELLLAMTDEVVSAKLKVLPVRVDNCKVPSFLADKLYLDIQREEYNDFLSKLFSRIQDKLTDTLSAPAQIEVVSLDLDNALCNNALDEYLWRHLIPKLYSVKNGITFDEAFTYVTAEYAKLWGIVGGCWRDPDYWLARLRLETSFKVILPKIASKFFIYPDVLKVLRQLNHQYRLVLVSSATRKLLDYKLKRGGISNLFWKTYSASSDFDLAAKYESAYVQVCRDLQISPDRILHCGDNTVFDVEIPRRLGIHAVLLDRRAAQKDRKALTNLADLVALLKTLRGSAMRKQLRSDPQTRPNGATASVTSRNGES
jgi:FMN phosphatase YigB (HAD superfamily)